MPAILYHRGHILTQAIVARRSPSYRRHVACRDGSEAPTWRIMYAPHVRPEGGFVANLQVKRYTEGHNGAIDLGLAATNRPARAGGERDNL